MAGSFSAGWECRARVSGKRAGEAFPPICHERRGAVTFEVGLSPPVRTIFMAYGPRKLVRMKRKWSTSGWLAIMATLVLRVGASIMHKTPRTMVIPGVW